jgi:hypothetical protein
MQKKSRRHTGLTKADLERAAAALRILDAYAKFGLALIRGKDPIRPPLRTKVPGWHAATTWPYLWTMARHWMWWLVAWWRAHSFCQRRQNRLDCSDQLFWAHQAVAASDLSETGPSKRALQPDKRHSEHVGFRLILIDHRPRFSRFAISWSHQWIAFCRKVLYAASRGDSRREVLFLSAPCRDQPSGFAHHGDNRGRIRHLNATECLKSVPLI